MGEKVKFGSRIGLIAATVGSAVGLGNVWRFPAEAQAGGGAAFLLVYIVCVVILGIPVMVSEFSLGRGTEKDAVNAFRKLSPGSYWWLTGAVALLASYMILCFYMVVAGWTLEYLLQSFTGALYETNSGISELTNEAMKGVFNSRMEEYIHGTTGPLVNTFAMIIISTGILIMGVRKGIERMSNMLMPVLFAILLLFCCVAVGMPKASEGLEFFFAPDFSKLTPTVVINALGQAFFSLSLGMGILITYSSYYPRSTKLTRTATLVSSLDLLVAIMMGVIIFPTVMTYGLDHESVQGATLLFVTLPEVFVHMGGTQFWSTAFFLLLTVAALTSIISISEVTIAFFQNHFRMRRVKASLVVMLPLFVLSTLCSLSLGLLSEWKIAGMVLFDFLDYATTNIMLPLVAFLTCVYLGWKAPEKFLQKEITNHGKLQSVVLPAIVFIIKWIAPVLIAIIFISQFL